VRAPNGAVLGAALVLAGCGSTTAPSSPTTSTVALTAQEQHGKSLFVSTCGACHTLADAGTHGTAGPDLDVHPWRSVYVREVIASGPGLMPDDLIRGPDADAVAAYLAAVTHR